MLSKPAAARFGERVAGAAGGVQPRQPAQLVLPERLDAEAEPVHPRAPVRGETRFGHRLGVRLQRHFAIGGHVEGRRAGVDDARDFVRLEQRRRAAAEENGVGLRGGRPRSLGRDLRDQRIDVAPP